MNIPDSWGLPVEIKQRFGLRGAGKQRSMTADGHLLLVLHQAPRHGKRERVSVFFWRKPNGEWLCSKSQEGLQSLRQHIKEYETAEQEYSNEYEQVDEAEDYFRILENMAPLHRAAKNLHAVLQSAREAVPADQNLIDLRDQAYNLDRTLDLLYADTKNALDYQIAKTAEQQAQLSLKSVETADRLNILAAIFFPLTAISSLFGMNFPTGLEDASLAVFWGVLLVGMILGFFIRGWAITGSWNIIRTLKNRM